MHIYGNVNCNMKLFDNMINSLGERNIFLGNIIPNIYFEHVFHTSILKLKVLLERLNIGIVEANIQMFDEIAKTKKLHLYNPFSRYNDFDIDEFDTVNESNNIFLFGNNEIEFIMGMLKGFVKYIEEEQIYDIHIGYFESSKYSNTKHYIQCLFKLSQEELNILYSYFNVCGHYYIYDNTLFINNYQNSRILSTPHTMIMCSSPGKNMLGYMSKSVNKIVNSIDLSGRASRQNPYILYNNGEITKAYKKQQ